MITVLTGENSYEIEQVLAGLISGFEGDAEKFDGENLDLKQLPDLFSGQSLFAEKRLVVIRELSKNKSLWEALPEFLGRMSDDIHLVLVEASPDKRTKTYKALHRAANVKEFQPMSERDTAAAQRWLLDEAKAMGVKLDTATARELLRRSLVMSPKGQPSVDQWRAKHALEKLSVFETVTVELVQQYIAEQSVNTVFSIFETALKGDEVGLHRLLHELELKEDPFRVFGLLSGQSFQLAALNVSSVSSADTAKAIGAHPFAVSKLTSHAQKLSRNVIKEIVLAFKEADEDMKLSKADSWVLIERALIKTARLVKNK